MKSIDEFVKQNSSSSKFKDIHDFVGKPQVDSYFQADQQFNPMVHDSSMPFVAPHKSVSVDPTQSPVMKSIDQFVKDNPIKPTWNGVIDNPIVRTAGNVLGAIGTGIEHVKDATGLSNVQGAVRGFSTADLPTHKADGTYLGEYKALAQNTVEGVANIAKSTVQGFLHPKEADKKFGEIVDKGLTNTNPITRFAGKMLAESATDPTSYIPIPVSQIVKGFKNLPSAVSTALNRFASRNSPIKDLAPEVHPTLALPPASAESLAAYAKRNGNVNVLPTNTKPILGQGDVQTMALNESNTPRIISDIKQQANDLIKPPTSRRDLIDYVGQHLQISREEVVKLSNSDLYEVGQGIRKTANMDLLHGKIASDQGHNWNDLVSGNSVTGNVEAPLNRIQDVRPPAKPNLIGAKQGVDTPLPPVQRQSIHEFVNAKPIETAPKTTVLPDQKIKGQQLKDLKTGDETKFAQTVQQSEHTAPELTQKLSEQTVVGARTTDVLNRQQATKLIEQHGNEGLYSKLMAKKQQFSASETTAAQILAKQYSSMGGKENLTKAIDLVSKTAKGGREMGQAIQALSQWNKLDETGALLLGERQLNRGVTDMTEWKKLSTEQAAPIQEAAQRAEVATQTKSLADEVLHIVTNKQAGEALTDAEKATIKQFNDQVKSINDKTKPFLPQEKANKQAETIKQVREIEPKARTRDQVVSFLDAKADLARKRLAASRQMGFAAVNKGNPVIDYGIIGASHIAKGVVKLSDFTEAMVRDFGESVKPHINEAFTMATNIFRKENGLPTIEALDRVVNKAVKDERFTKEDAANFKAWASEIGHYADHNLKVEAVQDLQAAMKDLGDSTLGQKIATVQTGSMLLNPVTIERNVLGNAVQLIGDKVSKIVTVPIDWAASKVTGEQRTIVFKAMNQEKFWKNFMSGTVSNYKGVSPNGMLDSYGIHPNVFSKNNPLKYVTKLLGASLGGFDHAFYSSAKGEVLATYAEQLGKAQGLSHAEIKKGMKDLIVQLDDRINEMADHAGKYATYQDETMLSKGAEAIRGGLNEASTGIISRKLVENGMSKKLSMEGFGAGDVLLKFAKTPANLVMRGIDYSPIGFIHSMMDLGTFALNRGKFNQHEAVRTLGRAITGTLGFTGMGYILADAGILTGSASMDKDVRSIQEQSGQGAYKVNWSALSRFFRSGFSYDAAAYQKGDHLMDYQWLQPAAISVAMGVNANKAVQAHKAGDTTAGWQMAGKALLGGLQTVLENPMVQGLSNLVDAGSDILKKQDPTKLINIAKGVPASFVPTLSNQARTATDNNQRETFDKSLLTEIGNMMANKVPGLSSKLPISYDSLGNAREKLQGGHENTVTQYLTSFFSPAKMTEYQVSPEAKMVLDIMNQSGDASVLPRIVGKYFKVSQGAKLKDLKVNLNKEQFSQLQQETGKMVTEELSKKAEYLANPNVALQHKVDVVKKILSDIGKRARQDIGQQMGYQKNKVKG